MGVIQKQGIQNTIIIYVGIVIGFVSLIIIQPLYLTKSEIGLTRLLLAFATLFSSIFTFSISNITVKFFPYFKDYSNKHNGFFGLTILLPVIGSLIGCLILLIFKNYITQYYSKDSQIFVHFFYHTFLLSFILSIVIALNSYCNCLLKTTVPSFLNDIFIRVVFILLILLYAAGFINYTVFVLLFVLSYSLQALLLMGYIYYYGAPSFKINKQIIEKIGLKYIVKFGAVLTITAITSLSMKFLDMIMIGHYKQDSDVGVYSIAVFIATVIETPLNSLERIANPKIAHGLAINNLKEVKDIYFKSSKYLSIIGGLLTILIISNIKDLLLLLPNDYSEGVIVTIIMSASALVNMVTGINHPIIFNSSKYYYGSIFIVIMLVISLILNIVLIPVFGIMGAAIATATASAVYNILKYFFIWKEFNMQPFDKNFIKIFFIILISFLIGYIIPNANNHYLNILINGAVVTSTYMLLTYMLRIVPEFHQYIPIIGKKYK